MLYSAQQFLFSYIYILLIGNTEIVYDYSVPAQKNIHINMYDLLCVH
jgi:hypothetical protein